MQTVGYSEWKLRETDDRQQGLQGLGEEGEGERWRERVKLGRKWEDVSEGSDT